MIPKILHYCWFGKSKKPQQVVEYIKQWRKLNPDYEIKEWNESNFDYTSIPYTHEAYLLKKYAFVSDVARLYALYTEGGIYLDTDIRCVKSFDILLTNTSFIGKEAPFRISTACIGAEKGSLWILDFMNSYLSTHFIGYNGIADMDPNTWKLTDYLNRTLDEQSHDLTIYDIDVLCAKTFPLMKNKITEKTICVHEYSGSWKKNSTRRFARLKNIYIHCKVNNRSIFIALLKLLLRGSYR